MFAISCPTGVKLLSRLRLKISQLNEHKFRHNFKDALSHICDCNSKTETREHFFLRGPFFAINRQKSLHGLIGLSWRNLKDELLLDIILYSSDKYKKTVNKEILLHKISFTKNTKRIERPLPDHWFTFFYFVYYFFWGFWIWNTTYFLAHPSVLVFPSTQHSAIFAIIFWNLTMF